MNDTSSNIIVEAIDGNYIAGVVSLHQGYNNSKVFILVEGETDEKVYSNFIFEENAEIIISYGKINLKNAMDTLDKQSVSGVIAIKDADFDIIDGYTRPSNFFLTDCHDLETMIIYSDALVKFLKQVIEVKHLSNPLDKLKLIDDVKTHLINFSCMLGFLDYMSQKNSWGLDVNVNKFFNKFKNNLDIDLVKIVQYFKTECSLIDELLCSSSEFDAMKKVYEKYLHNGHKLITVLTEIIPIVAIKYLKPRQKLSIGSHVARQLFLAYEYDLFKKTSLYHEIKSWESSNRNYKVWKG